MTTELQSLEKGVAFLNESQIEFDGDRVSGYEYKNWTPIWIPFIQASPMIWPIDEDGRLPDSVLIPGGRSFDFQMITPRDHPFLLIDVKVAATRFLDTEDGPTNMSRFNGSPEGGCFDPINQFALWKKYLMPDAEKVDTTFIAVSPGGKPIWGALQESTGQVNGIATVGPEPHVEKLPLFNSQNVRSGKGSLQTHLLFPEDGIMRVTVYNNDTSMQPGEGIKVNGVVFGYVIMR